MQLGAPVFRENRDGGKGRPSQPNPRNRQRRSRITKATGVSGTHEGWEVQLLEQSRTGSSLN